MMMILRRRLREIGKIENERDKGMDLFWICLSSLSLTCMRGLLSGEVIQILVNKNQTLDLRRTWTIMIQPEILMTRMTRLTETTKLQLPTPCFKWWTKSDRWSRWQWRKPRRRRIHQAKNVSRSNFMYKLSPSFMNSDDSCYQAGMKIWFKHHPWPHQHERRKFLSSQMFIKSHKHKIMSWEILICRQHSNLQIYFTHNT